MVTNNFNDIASDLENQELESPKGIASAQIYARLLALYLYQNDLCNAKYLWKRIPKSIESNNQELNAIWAVGQNMWKRDFPATYQSLMAYTWSESVSKIMNSLEDQVRERAIALIARAYSSLSIDTVSMMTGLSTENALQMCRNRGWTVEHNNMIIPLKPIPSVATQTYSEDQLYKLTEFVSSLEI